VHSPWQALADRLDRLSSGWTIALAVALYAVYLTSVMPAPLGGLTGTETILLVEDEEAVRTLTSEVLKRHGYTVLVAGCGAEALQVFGQNPGPIQLMVADVGMPGMSGRQPTGTA